MDRKVLGFFLNARRIAKQAKAEERGNYIGSEWLWNVDRLRPELVPISQASVGHFCCDCHEKKWYKDADNLQFPEGDSYSMIDERDCEQDQWLFAQKLSMLAWRALGFRVNQMKIAEKAATDQRSAQVDKQNRFSVEWIDSYLRQITATYLPLYRHKLLLDRRYLEIEEAPLIHHIVPLVVSLRVV